MKKNNLIYLFYLPSFTGGGSEMVTINLANEFHKNNKKVIFLCSNTNGPLFFRLNNKIKIINLKKKRLLLSIFKIFNIILNEKPDVIFSSLVHSNLFFCIIKKYFNKNFFLIIRHGNIKNQRTDLKSKIKNFIFIKLIKFFYQYSDLIVSSGTLAKKYLKYELGIKKKIFNINNPIFNKKEFEKKIKIKNEWIQKNKYNYYLSIGRLNIQKNFIFLIKAFKKLNFSKKNKLLIIGEGEQNDYINNFLKENNLSDNIKIINFQKNPLNFIYYCKCFVLSSLWEGQSNVLLQAAILRKKIICSDTAGDVKFLSKKFENIHIYKSNNFHDFKKKIDSALISNDNYIKNKFHRYSNSFSNTEVAKRYIKIISSKI